MSSTSSRRSSSRTNTRNSNTISDDQIIDLVTKLQQLLPELHNRSSSRRNSDRISASKVLQETCNYIKNLHREVDGLSERLSLLLETTDHTNTAQAAIIRSLLL